MTAAALSGWALALGSCLVVALAWRLHEVRMEAVARASHELRGPLTAATLGLELGIRAGELSRSRMRAIDLELRRAALALDDLSHPGRPWRGTLRRVEQVDVETLVADSVEAWQASAAGLGRALEVAWTGPAGRVWGDRLRLAQALGNLVANAIEHGGEAVAVRGRVEQKTVRVEVIDGGPGLPAPVAELIRLARGGRGRRGRGLAIAAAIAREHRGRLASAPTQRGARLVLELPAASGTPPWSPAAS